MRSPYFQTVLMKFAKKRTFWVIIITFTLVCLFHYAEVLGMPDTAYPSFHFGLTRHTFDRILFFIPIIYAAFLFGRRGALITSFAALAAMLPRAILISPVGGCPSRDRGCLRRGYDSFLGGLDAS